MIKNDKQTLFIAGKKMPFDDVVKDKIKRMTYVFGRLIKQGYADTENTAHPSAENQTIVIKDKNQKTLCIINIENTGIFYNLSIANSTISIKLEDVFFNEFEVKKTLIDWINCFLNNIEYDKFKKNQKIVDYLSCLFSSIDPSDCDSNLSLKLKSNYPEIVVEIGNEVCSTTFGVRENGACFVLMNIQTNKNIVINYTDYLIGDKALIVFKQWLVSNIYVEEIS